MKMPNEEQLKAKWQRNIGAAKIFWGEVTEDELLKLKGRKQRLAGLARARYIGTRDVINKKYDALFPDDIV